MRKHQAQLRETQQGAGRGCPAGRRRRAGHEANRVPPQSPEPLATSWRRRTSRLFLPRASIDRGRRGAKTEEVFEETVVSCIEGAQ